MDNFVGMDLEYFKSAYFVVTTFVVIILIGGWVYVSISDKRS